MFIGILIEIVLSMLAILYFLPRNMFIVSESNLGFEETLEAITKSAAQNQWNIPNIYDLQSTMKKNSYDVKPVKVMSLCKPEHAFQILGSKEERFVSALMPCRVSVYEKDGKTYISMLNAGLFSRFMGKKIGKVMNAAGIENKQLFEGILKK